MARKYRQYFIIVFLLIFLTVLIAASIPSEVKTVLFKGIESKDIKTVISNYMGISVASCEVLQEKDSHGGFFGEGQTFVELQATETEFDHIVGKMTSKWKDFPLTENISQAVYGKVTKEGNDMPLIVDEDSNSKLIPSIEKGYYYFEDRNDLSIDSADDSKLFKRSSYNFTLVICDEDRNKIYYIEYDT